MCSCSTAKKRIFALAAALLTLINGIFQYFTGKKGLDDLFVVILIFLAFICIVVDVFKGHEPPEKSERLDVVRSFIHDLNQINTLIEHIKDLDTEAKNALNDLKVVFKTFKKNLNKIN